MRLNYLPCPKAGDGRNVNSRIIINRVCLNETKQTYRRQVSPSTCKRCISGSKLKELPKIPVITTRILTYLQALTKWKASGKPIRSDEEVERIFNASCAKCKSHKKNRCLFCGCRVAINGYPIMNKLKMATEHCPKGLW